MVLVKQIIPCAIINLEIADIYGELVRGVFLDLSEYVAQSSGDQASVCVALGATCDGERFARVGLAYSECLE